MFFLFFLTLLHNVHCDLIAPNPEDEGLILSDNIFVKALVTMSLCTCAGVACHHHKLLPIKIEKTTNHYNEDEYYHIEPDKQSTNNYKQDIKKLKRDLRELQSVLTKLDKT